MTRRRQPLLAFYRVLSRQRRLQLAAVFGVTLIGALAELMTIGAALAFIALIATRERDSGAAGFLARFDGDPVAIASMLLVTAAITAALIRLFLLWLSHRFVMGVGHDMATRIFGRMLRQPYRDHAHRGSSEVLSGIDKVQSVVADLLQPGMQGLTAGVIAVLIVASLFTIDAWAAGLTAIVVILLYGTMSRVITRRVRRNSKILSESATARIKIVQEGLGGIRDIILDHAQPLFEDKFRRVDARYRRARAATDFISVVPRFVVEAAGIVALALTAVAMSLRPGGIMAAVPMLGALALGMQRLLPLVQQAYAGWARSAGTLQLLADVTDLMDTPVAPDGPAGPVGRTAILREELRLDGVSYRHGKGSFALQAVNLRIRRGSRVGISGPTGGGKSTLLDLIMGLLEPDAGTISVDGVPLDPCRRMSWMGEIAHVPQSIYLADDSIAANIAFGRSAEELDQERLAAVVRAAQLETFIAELPEGFSTRVGERGIRLSGGQRQRIGIARALYKNAPVLILDEATSALDDATQAAVMAAIMAERKTIILVAHRRSTLADCDQIVHVEGGRVTASETAENQVRRLRRS